MSKSKMAGAIENYTKMFKTIMNWDSSEIETGSKYYKSGTHKVLGDEAGHYLDSLGWILGDMGYHGWEGEPARNECKIYDKVSTAYYYLLKSLAEAIGFEYTDESVWRYHLKDINTDDILKLNEKIKNEVTE